MAQPGLFLFIFVLLHGKYSTNRINYKCVDGVLGTRTGVAGWQAQTNSMSYGSTPKNTFCYFQCNNCSQLVVHPEQRFNFFSDYSQMVSCPHCGSQEAHFAKTLSAYVRADEAAAARQHTNMVNSYLGIKLFCGRRRRLIAGQAIVTMKCQNNRDNS